MVDTVRFQAVGDSEPVRSKESGGFGKPRGPVDPKREVVTNRKTNPLMMKRITNFVLEMVMIGTITLNPFRELQKKAAMYPSVPLAT